MKRISINVHTLVSAESQQTPPELFNEVFWEIILTWMQVEVHRGQPGREPQTSHKEMSD